MSHSLFKFLIVLIIILVIVPSSTQAQETNQEFRISIYRSKVTNRTSALNGFFNTTTLAFEYQRRLINNLNGVVGVRYIQIIAQGDGNINTGTEALNRFAKSFLTFDTGISLIPFSIGKKLEIRFSPGLSLRHRNEVFPVIAFEPVNYPVSTTDIYQNQWDLGGFFNLGFVYSFNDKWLLELRGQFHTYKVGGSVFDVGLSFGRKF